MKNEITSLQVVRAIAAISVVINHMIGASPGEFLYFTRSIGNVGVDLFFVLSGLVMVLTLRDTDSSWTFIKKRIIRIYPTYLILSLPIIAFTIYKTHPEIVDILSNITLIPRFDLSFNRFNVVNWTLVFEMYFYMVMSISLMLSRDKIKVTIITTTLLLVFMVFSKNSGLAAFDDLAIKSLPSNYILIDFVMGMFAGLYFSLKSIKESNSSWRLISSVIIFILSAWMLTNYHGQIDNIQAYRFLCSGIPAFIIILLISPYKSKGKIFNKMKKIGDASYSIYLTHTTIRIIAWKFESLTIRALFIIASIIFGYICHILIEKKLMKYFRR